MKIIETGDGSQTIMHPILHEQYHSLKGALEESMHIFISCGLDAFNGPNANILEMGFGTGLNALLAAQWALLHHKHITYTTFELYPLTLDEVAQLNYKPQDLYKAIHAAPWQEPTPLNSYYTLLKLNQDFIQTPLESKVYDLIFYDAFSPETQPQLWTPTIYSKLYDSLKINGLLTTYCAKGVVRRGLEQAGFKVERLKGPEHGKREILRARKLKP